MEDLGKEVDEYFAKKYPLKAKKVLCHQCGGAVDNSLQQLKAEIASRVSRLESAFNDGDEFAFDRLLDEIRQLSAV